MSPILILYHSEKIKTRDFLIHGIEFMELQRIDKVLKSKVISDNRNFRLYKVGE